MFLFCMELRDQVLLKENAFQEKRIMKSPAIPPPRNDPIPNQDINRLITKQDTIISSIMDINHYLMIGMIQIVQKMTLIIIQIVHRIIKNIL